MRIANDFVQGSKEWVASRATGIGASEIAVVLGISPFQTQFELWCEKTKLVARPPFPEYAVKAMAKGSLYEPEARAAHEKIAGGSFIPLNILHDEYDWLKASLDGYCKKLNRIGEYKVPGKAALAKARKGKIDDHYFAQVQLQLLLSGTESCDFGVFDADTKEIFIINIKPDLKMHKEIIEKATWFWDLVITKKCPPITKKDLAKSMDRLSDASDRLRDAHNAIQLVVENLAA